MIIDETLRNLVALHSRDIHTYLQAYKLVCPSVVQQVWAKETVAGDHPHVYLGMVGACQR